MSSYYLLIRYCAYIRRDPRACFESVSVKLLYMFFDWLLNQK